MTSLGEFPLKIGSALSESVGRGEVDRFTRRVKIEQHSLGWAVQSPCSEPGGPFLVFDMNVCRKESCHLVGPPFQVLMAVFLCSSGLPLLA